jgi:hypothetical protein
VCADKAAQHFASSPLAVGIDIVVHTYSMLWSNGRQNVRMKTVPAIFFTKPDKAAVGDHGLPGWLQAEAGSPSRVIRKGTAIFVVIPAATR